MTSRTPITAGRAAEAVAVFRQYAKDGSRWPLRLANWLPWLVVLAFALGFGLDALGVHFRVSAAVSGAVVGALLVGTLLAILLGSGWLALRRAPGGDAGVVRGRNRHRALHALTFLLFGLAMMAGVASTFFKRDVFGLILRGAAGLLLERECAIADQRPSSGRRTELLRVVSSVVARVALVLDAASGHGVDSRRRLTPRPTARVSPSKCQGSRRGGTSSSVGSGHGWLRTCVIICCHASRWESSGDAAFISRSSAADRAPFSRCSGGSKR